MKLWQPLALIILISSFSACKHGNCSSKKDNMTNTETVQTGLEGSWKIIKRVCCGRMNKETLGGKKTLVLTAGTFEIKGDEDGDASGKYTLNNSEDMGPMIQLGDKYPAMYSLKGDTLILDWGYMDLATETYIRK